VVNRALAAVVNQVLAVQNQVVDLAPVPLKVRLAVLHRVQTKIPLVLKVLKDLNLVIIQIVIAVIVITPLQNQILALHQQVMVLQRDSIVVPTQLLIIVILQEILRNLLILLITAVITLKHIAAVVMDIAHFGHHLDGVVDTIGPFILDHH
jgi:hypothetical protein